MPKNGNITGEVFDEQVTKQIEYRQNFIGARYKTDANIVYGNNVNAFLRLASSVNVGTSSSPIDVLVSGSSVNDVAAQQKAQTDLLEEGRKQLINRGIDQNLTGMELAKACVLFGGTVGVDDKLNPKFKVGIVDNNGSGAYDYVSSIAAYGWGGIASRGFVPMPHIESADVSFFNRGALAKATVKIKVYSVEQLQIFDALYFRIGYTMLLEWGHNIWLDNNLAKNTSNFNPLKTRNEFVTKPFELFFTEGSTQQDIINSIHKQRENDSYNYDAMLGKVTNFTWKFNDDGSYDIDLNLVGLGDIIESLKINKASIITGKTELTPSQLASKKQAQIDAGYKNLDASDKDATSTAQAVGKTITEKITNANTKISGYIKQIKSVGNKINSNRGDGKNFKNTILNFSIQVSADKNTNSSEIDKATALKTSNLEWKQSFIDDRPTLEFGDDNAQTQFKNQGQEFIYTTIKDRIADIISVINSINGENLADQQKAADAEAERIKRQNELIRKGYDAASQKLKRDEEIRSLSPVTSVETKNKTSLNLQLYNWRQDAIAGANKNNLYKLTFTADSSNASATGTPKLSLNFYYVRLGYLLDWIQNNLLVYDNTKKYNPDAITFEPKTQPQTDLNSIQTTTPASRNADLVLGDQGSLVLNASTSPTSLANQGVTPTQTPPSANPIFEIDTDPEKNFCLRFPAQFSADPKVCIIPSKYGFWAKGTSAKDAIFWDILPELKDYFVNGNSYAGKLMNIYVNIDHAAGCVDKNTDANGKTSLLKFLTSLLNDVNDALGNVNKLEPIFDAESNMLKIIEGSSVEKVEELINAKERNLNNMAVFQVYGIGTDSTPYGSFIKNVDFQVQLPPNMAAMATISAQASGNIVGENATGLSKLNKGLTDRLITIKLDKDSIEGAQTGKIDPKVIFQQNLQSVQKVINSLYVDKFYSKDTIDSIRSANRDIALYLTGNDALAGNMPAPFFIPFNLSLTMDGLSGMRNYERFSISEQVLPYSYRPNTSTNRNGVIDFLIKGISHSIKDNKWETKIESLTVSSNRKWSIQDIQNVSTQNQP